MKKPPNKSCPIGGNSLAGHPVSYVTLATEYGASMSDSRFFRAEGPFALGHIAELVGAELNAPERASEMVRDIADLEQAVEGQISVFSDRRHASAFAQTNASVVVTSRTLAGFEHNGSTLLLADDPRQAFARIGQLFYPRVAPERFIHPKAAVAGSARIGADCSIAAGAVI